MLAYLKNIKTMIVRNSPVSEKPQPTYVMMLRTILWIFGTLECSCMKSKAKLVRWSHWQIVTSSLVSLREQPTWDQLAKNWNYNFKTNFSHARVINELDKFYSFFVSRGPYEGKFYRNVKLLSTGAKRKGVWKGVKTQNQKKHGFAGTIYSISQGRLGISFWFLKISSWKHSTAEYINNTTVMQRLPLNYFNWSVFWIWEMLNITD